jgi:peptidoglycan/xylan/chitin deacetylase (PgdA/CDA1 family)
LIILASAPWFFFYFLWRLKFKRPPGRTVPILVYHRVADRFDWSITRQRIGQFKKGLEFLKEQGFGAARLSELVQTPKDLHENKLVITFDDAYEDIYNNAFPVLRELGFTASIFVVTGYVGKPSRWDYRLASYKKRHMSWQQMNEMAKEGFEFGSHTVNHPDLTRIPREFVKYELERSKETLEQNLNQRVDFLSYPFGRYDLYIEEQAEKAGYKSAYTICSNHGQEPSWFSQPRKGVYLLDSPLTMRIKLYPGRLAWIEEMKGRVINRFSSWTIALKGSPDYDAIHNRDL